MKIGIWGFGIVGKAALNYCATQHQHISIFDQRELTLEERSLIASHQASVYPNNDLRAFLEEHEVIIPSPGIDLRPYAQYAHKWWCELDILQERFQKHIISITGSIGKTTVTHIISSLFAHHTMHWWTGGNIGIGALALLCEKDSYDGALLEVSSFQLERCHIFAPDLALITNILPNHLDRHGTLNAYIQAKIRPLFNQKAHQNAIVPLELLKELEPYRTRIKSSIHFFTPGTLTTAELSNLYEESIFFIKNDTIVHHHHGRERLLVPITDLPSLSFKDNWLLVCSALDLLHISISDILTNAHAITLPAHRCERIPTDDGIHWYNDSKSTTIVSTLAAVTKLAPSPVHLFVGGLSKGIDRSALFEQLPPHVIAVYCFGKESEELTSKALLYYKNAYAFSTLQEAFDACVRTVRRDECVLFSPSGSSYDLFKDYQERGDCFKFLVKNRI